MSYRHYHQREPAYATRAQARAAAAAAPSGRTTRSSSNSPLLVAAQLSATATNLNPIVTQTMSTRSREIPRTIQPTRASQKRNFTEMSTNSQTSPPRTRSKNSTKSEEEVDSPPREEPSERQAHYSAPPGTITSVKRCNCKNSKCLKSYCKCFAASVYCSDCNCESCFNTPEHVEIVEDHRRMAIERDPTAFDAKIDNVQDSKLHKKGCKCGKTNCLKKYCECFQAGVYCSEMCRCVECKNYDGSPELVALLTRDPSILDQAASVNKRRKLEGEIKAERFPIPADAADAFKRMLRLQEPQWRRPQTSFVKAFDEELNEESIREYCTRTLGEIETFRSTIRTQLADPNAASPTASSSGISPPVVDVKNEPNTAGPFKSATPTKASQAAQAMPSPTSIVLGEAAEPKTPAENCLMQMEAEILNSLKVFLADALDRIAVNEKSISVPPYAEYATARRLGPPAPLPGLVAGSTK